MKINLILIITTALSCSSERIPGKFKQYEGLYEYLNETQLYIAAPPNDSVLIALLDGAKYPLRPVGHDTFLNGSNNRVIFRRDETNRIIGYTQEGEDVLLKLLSDDVHFPEEMWYPKPGLGNRKYAYHPPHKMEDGLSVGDIGDTPIRQEVIEQMVNDIIDRKYPDIHSVLILKDGKLVFEEYFYEYGIDTPHQLRSATKSFVSALVAIAIDRGFIRNTEEKVLPFFKEYEALDNPSAEKSNISIADLLTMQSGLECNDWDWNSRGNESKMVRTDDWAKFILDLPMASKSGTQASYCSGCVILLGRIVEKSTGMAIRQFADKYLFGPLGIKNYNWNFKPDKSSSETFCQLYLRPRDMAKFGLLFADNGMWHGQQIISEELVRESLGKHAFLGDSDYGYLWWHQWLNVRGERFDAVLATGNGGQKIHIWKDLHMITVLTGGNYNTQSPSNEILIDYILPSFKKRNE